MSLSSDIFHFFTNYPKAIIVADSTGKILFANPAFIALSEYTTEKINAVRLNELLEFPNSADKNSTGVLTDLKKDNGAKISVEVNVSNFELPEGLHVNVYTFESNTLLERCSTERDLLSKRVEQLNEELERFAYVTSHDLQAPLRMVSSYMQLIQKSLDKGETDRAREFMSYVQDGVSNLHDLIDGLLQFSRINRKGNPFVKLDLNEVIRAVTFQLSKKIEVSGANLLVGKMPVIQGDLSQLKQLFLNLIDNALKFRNTDKKPIVNISVSESETEYKFSIKDNGIGIEPKYHERIFQIFQRLHSRSDYEGTGAGLAVCKKIVENHGGEIWVESDKDSGANFCFTLKK